MKNVKKRSYSKRDQRFAILSELLADDPLVIKELAQIGQQIDHALKTPMHHEMFALEKCADTLTLCRTIRQYARRCNVTPDTYIRIAMHVIPTYKSNPHTRSRMLASMRVYKKVRARLSEDYQRGELNEIKTMHSGYGTRKSVLASLHYLRNVKRTNPAAFTHRANIIGLLTAIRYTIDPVLLYDVIEIRKRWADILDMPCSLSEARILHAHRSEKVIALMELSDTWCDVLHAAQQESAA